jgi:uncharacterized protein (TIGR02646 family)
MIRIIKPNAAPRNLIRIGQAKTAEDCAAYDADPGDYLSGVLGFAKTERDRLRQRAIYGAKPVKKKLVTTHRSKCCYCETKYEDPRHLAIEHFRPKVGVRQSSAHPTEYPGYYWLAYDWDNLLLSCHECNSDYKRTFFPLANPQSRARSHHDDLSIERPLLVNPVSPNPRRHIRFQDETPYHRTRKGRITIEVIGLRRTRLRDARFNYLAELKSSLEIVEVAEKYPRILELRKLADEAQAFIDSATLPCAPFSSMSMDYLNK